MTPPNTWFFGPQRVYTPNGASIDLAVFVGLMVVHEETRELSGERDNARNNARCT